MADKTGLRWENIDLVEIVAQSARWLRKAIRYSDERCEVKKWVDAKLLEALWCPRGKGGETDPKWICKDVIRTDLPSTPDGLWEGTCEWNFDHDKCRRQCHAGGLLARVLLGPMDWLFKCEKREKREYKRRKGGPLLWVIAKLYDQLGGVNFYRSLSSMNCDDSEYRVGQFLFRIAEAKYDWFKERIADFSTLLREAEDKTEVDYCLVCTEDLWNERPEEEGSESVQPYNISSIMSIIDQTRVESLRKILTRGNNEEVSKQLSRRVLSPLTQRYREEEADRARCGTSNAPLGLNDMACEPLNNSKIRDIFDKATAEIEGHNCFYRGDTELGSSLEEMIERLEDSVRKKSGIQLAEKAERWKLANYFVWLKALHKSLGSYTVRYAANYRLLPSGDYWTEEAQNRIQNACFVIASRELPSRPLLAAARVSLTHCLGPLEDYYAIRQACRMSASRTRADIGTGMFHNLLQYMHSLGGHIGTLDNKLANVRERAKSNPNLYPVAEALDGSKAALADAYRFQKAVYNCLAMEENNNVATARRSAPSMSMVPADQRILDCLRTALTAIHGAAKYIMHEEASSSYVGIGNLMMLRALSGCSYPDRDESVMDWDDSLHLAELRERLRSREMQLACSNPLPAVTLEGAMQAYGAWGFDLRLDLADQMRMPLDLDVLVVNELVLNSLRASAVAMWKSRRTDSKARAVVSICCANSCLTITNTALESSIAQAQKPVKRPIGKASGWGQWATNQLLLLQGLQLPILERVTIDHQPALRTTIRWGDKYHTVDG